MFPAVLVFCACYHAHMWELAFDKGAVESVLHKNLEKPTTQTWPDMLNLSKMTTYLREVDRYSSLCGKQRQPLGKTL